MLTAIESRTLGDEPIHALGGVLLQLWAVESVREWLNMSDDERLVAFHEMLRLQALELTADGLRDLRGFIDVHLATRLHGPMAALPWDRLPENVRGPRQPLTHARGSA